MENCTEVNGQIKLQHLIVALKKAIKTQEKREEEVKKKMYDKLLSGARQTIITGKN